MKALATVGRTTIIHKDRFAYNAHPSITILDNGEWLVVFNHSRRRERLMHPPGDPLYRHLLTRTLDGGGTWEEPYFVPDYAWSGNECPGISRLSNGTVVLTQSWYGGFPLGLARKKRAAGEPILLSLPGQGYTAPGGGWTEDFTDDDWDRSQRPWALGYHGLYAHLSTDGGRTFEDPVKIDISPYREGYSRTGVVELLDGRVAYVVSGLYLALNKHFHVYILFSSTGGKSWDPPVLVAKTPDRAFGEPDIAEVAPGEIYCILRSHNQGGYLYGCRSLDGGHSWSVPEATPMCGGMATPGHLLVLRDGRLLCTYHRRTAPFGIRACLSEDGGRTWKIDQEIVIRDDLPNSDLGYPTTIEYAPGRLFVCYYGQDQDLYYGYYGQDLDGVTCIQGTYVTLT